MTAIFVTATGTGIGKTFITAGLIRQLRASGRIVDALKPVVTGFHPAAAETSDPGVLLSALDRPVTPEEIARISPWCYRAPLAPDMAARREGLSVVDFARLCGFCRRAVLTRRDALLIEGIGGIMTPLDDEHTVLDWMVALHQPLVLVAGSYLGTISHTLSAVDALLRRDMAVLTIIVNETDGSSVPLDDTVASIRRFVHPIDVLPMPRMAGAADARPFERMFAAAARASN